MKTPAALALCLSLLAGLIACDKDDDNMGTLIVNVRDNAKVEELNIYTEGRQPDLHEYRISLSERSAVIDPAQPGELPDATDVWLQSLFFSRFGPATRPLSIVPTAASMER